MKIHVHYIFFAFINFFANQEIICQIFFGIEIQKEITALIWARIIETKIKAVTAKAKINQPGIKPRQLFFSSLRRVFFNWSSSPFTSLSA